MDKDKLREQLTNLAGVFAGGIGTAVGAVSAAREFHNGHPVDAAITATVAAGCALGTFYAIGEAVKADQEENQE